MISFAKNLNHKLDPWRVYADKFVAPVLYLIIRLYIAQIFFQSGLLKFQNLLNGNWEATVGQFADLYPVPGLPASVAAVMGTAGEIVLPILLAFGLFGRFAALGLIGMTCVIQFLVPEDYGVANDIHYYWLMLLAVIVVRGAGTLSLDHLIQRRLK